MTIINVIEANTSKYVELLKERVQEKYSIKTTYPNKTVDLLAYVDKTMPLVLTAYSLDIEEKSNRHTHMFVGQLYKGQRRQTKNIDIHVEFWMHQTLVDMVCLDNGVTAAEREQLTNLWHIIRDVFDGQTYENSYSHLEKIVYNRASYSKFKDKKVDPIKTAKILNAADGLTPALASNYHYRVDVVPDHVKEAMWPYMHSFYDGTPQEVKDLYAENPYAHTDEEWQQLGVCFNWQFQAPIVLAYSIPNTKDHSRAFWNTSEFATSRDATMLSVGTNMWNVICTAEELGLNSCCLKAFQGPALDQITISTDEDMPEGWQWEPVIFACIGYGEKMKGDHRKYKPKGVVNTLEFSVTEH